jgi:TetR/AcrR family transcriptional regulator, regulator of mycofactocin system
VSREASPAPGGRKRITSRAELEQVAFGLFERQGFEGTTVGDIARAAGIGRRTFFRYFASKNDVPWGGFEERLERMRARLAGCPPQTPLAEAIRLGVITFHEAGPGGAGPGGEAWQRRRLELILQVPALQAHSTLRYAAWRRVIAEFAAARTGQPPDSLLPVTLGYAVQGVSVAACEQWLAGADPDLARLIGAAVRGLAAAFAVT